MAGWLASKFGRRNYFAFSILLFTIASFACGNSTNIWELVVFRFIQGIGGGALLSLSQAILFETYKPEERGMATALFGLGIVIGPTLGPTLGGYITDNFSWPWIFYINIPLGILAIVLTLTFIKESHHRRKVDRVDWLGIFLLVLGIASLQIVLERGQSEDWFDTNYIIVLAVVSALGIVAFIWRELVAEHPIVNLRILKDRSLAIGMVFTFILGFGMYASVFVFPIFCQNLLGFTAQQTGELMIPSGLITIFVMPFVGMMLRRGFPPQIMSAFGFVMFFVFTSMLSKANLSSGEVNFYIPLLFRGIGLGFLFVPLTTMALANVSPHDMPQGTGLNNMMRQLGGSFGIAIMTTFISKRLAYHRVNLLDHINVYNTTFTDRYNSLTGGFLSRGISADDAHQMANRAMEGIIYKQSTLLTYTEAFYIVGVFFLFCVPLLIFTGRVKKGKVIADSH
jgi:DHA2 family multidrug resistance protein